MWACNNGNVDIVKVLIDNGSDVNAKVSSDSLSDTDAAQC